MKERSFLFELIRCALWGGHLEGYYTPEIFWRVLQIADQQTVTGIVFDGINSLNATQRPTPDFIFEITCNALQIENSNLQLNRRIELIAEAFDKANIAPILVKGQGVASLYPNPLHRQCGDIDLYIPSNQFKHAFNLALSWKPIDYDYASEHANLKYDDWILELHSSLVDSKLWGSSRRMDKWFKGLLSQSKEKVCGMHVPDEILNVVFVFHHFFHHFMTSGAGLRQLCDWALCLKTFRSKYGTEWDGELENLLKSFNLLRPWQGFGNIVVDYIGLPKSMMPFYKCWEQQKVDKILNHIFDEGNFGHYSTKNHYSSRYLIRKWYSIVNQFSRQRELYGLFPKNALMSIKNPFNSIEQVVWEYKKGKKSRN